MLDLHTSVRCCLLCMHFKQCFSSVSKTIVLCLTFPHRAAKSTQTRAVHIVLEPKNLYGSFTVIYYTAVFSVIIKSANVFNQKEIPSLSF